MPIYAYECDQCHKTFDVLVGINQERSALQCPSCASTSLHRLFTPFRIGSSRSDSGSAAGSKCSSCSGGSCSSCHG